MRLAIDRLPSGRLRARLMIDGQCYTATLPTEADARLWELETRVAAALCRRAMLATFGAYTAGWLAEFIDDAPDRARFEAALERRLVPMLGALPLLEVLDADRDALHRQLVDGGGAGDDDDTRECLHLIREGATAELRAGALAAVAQGRQGRPVTTPLRE